MNKAYLQSLVEEHKKKDKDRKNKDTEIYIKQFLKQDIIYRANIGCSECTIESYYKQPNGDLLYLDLSQIEIYIRNTFFDLKVELKTTGFRQHFLYISWE